MQAYYVHAFPFPVGIKLTVVTISFINALSSFCVFFKLYTHGNQMIIRKCLYS